MCLNFERNVKRPFVSENGSIKWEPGDTSEHLQIVEYSRRAICGAIGAFLYFFYIHHDS